MGGIRDPDRNELKEKIKKEYESGAKPKELSEKYNISINTLKSWIKRSGWGKKILPQGAPQKKKKGAPIGNKNAEGNGAPKKNQNALKHGAYSSVYWDFLKEDEKGMLGIEEEEEILLMDQIRLFTIRERRIMQAINKYMDSTGGLYLSGVMKIENKRKFQDAAEEVEYHNRMKQRVKGQERMPGESVQVTSNTGATIDLISRLERELTSIQSKKTKCIEVLARLHFEKQRIEGDTQGNEVVNLWVDQVKAARGLNGE